MNHRIAIIAAAVAAAVTSLPVAAAKTHSYLVPPTDPSAESIVYYQKNHGLENGDNINLQNWATRFILSDIGADLNLGTVSVTAGVVSGNPGRHDGWIGIFGHQSKPNVKLSFDTINLGKNTALQLHGEITEEVQIGTVNVTGAVPVGADATNYDPEINAAQIET